MKKVPYHPQKLLRDFLLQSLQKLHGKRFSKSFWFFALKRKEHIRRKPRRRQRELALFSRRVLYAAQNDVKFKHTKAVKVFAQPFSSCGAISQRHGGVWGNAPHKPPLNFNLYTKGRPYGLPLCLIDCLEVKFHTVKVALELDEIEAGVHQRRSLVGLSAFLVTVGLFGVKSFEADLTANSRA